MVFSLNFSSFLSIQQIATVLLWHAPIVPCVWDAKTVRYLSYEAYSRESKISAMKEKKKMKERGFCKVHLLGISWLRKNVSEEMTLQLKWKGLQELID